MQMYGGEKESFFRRRIARPIVELLHQGVTPEKMALSLALGVALGVFPRARNHHGALRARGIPLAAEFAGDSNRELFCVPVADCAADSIFSRGRKTVWRAALAAVRSTDSGSGSREFLGRYPIFVDDCLARGGGVVLDRSCCLWYWRMRFSLFC